MYRVYPKCYAACVKLPISIILLNVTKWRISITIFI